MDGHLRRPVQPVDRAPGQLDREIVAHCRFNGCWDMPGVVGIFNGSTLSSRDIAATFSLMAIYFCSVILCCHISPVKQSGVVLSVDIANNILSLNISLIYSILLVV